MSFHDLPLIEEVGSLNPRLPSPSPPRKTASNAKAEMIDEDTIPDAHIIPYALPPWVKHARRRSNCWSCNLRSRRAKEATAKLKADNSKADKPKRDKVKSQADGIEDPAVRDFILAAEKRLKQIENGELIEEEPKKTKDQDAPVIDLSTATNMTAEDVEEFMRLNPFGIKRDTKDWFADW